MSKCGLIIRNRASQVQLEARCEDCPQCHRNLKGVFPSQTDCEIKCDVDVAVIAYLEPILRKKLQETKVFAKQLQYLDKQGLMRSWKMSPRATPNDLYAQLSLWNLLRKVIGDPPSEHPTFMKDMIPYLIQLIVNREVGYFTEKYNHSVGLD